MAARRRIKVAPSDPPFCQAVVDSVLERLQNIERELDLDLPEVFRCEGGELPLEREDVAEYRHAINDMTDVEALRIVALRLLTAARTQRHLATVRLQQNEERAEAKVRAYIDRVRQELGIDVPVVGPTGTGEGRKKAWLARHLGMVMGRP